LIAPTVSIQLTIRGSDLTLKIEGRNKVVEVEGSFDRLSLPRQKHVLKRDLERVVGCMGLNAQAGFQQAARALDVLHARGRTLLYNLFSNQRGKIYDAIQLFRDACPGWRRAGWDQQTLVPTTVQIDSSFRDVIPFDLLPLLDLDLPDRNMQSGTFDSIAQAANCFLGFASVVERKLRGTTVGTDRTATAPMVGHPKLRLQFFRYSGLNGAREEEDFFRNHPSIDLDGPWPLGRAKNPRFAEELVSNLLDPSRTFDGRPQASFDQITHFACHCDTTSDNDEEYSITLAGAGIWPAEQTITIRELQDRFARFDPPISAKSSPLPLVFFNACGSSSIDPASIASFPELFLAYNHRGFIGSETKIPDGFAAAFSKAFYKEFLANRRLADSVYLARWSTLRDLRNPLGLLYSVYADGGLRLQSVHETSP
jgi:hypothetical protein